MPGGKKWRDKCENGLGNGEATGSKCDVKMDGTMVNLRAIWRITCWNNPTSQGLVYPNCESTYKQRVVKGGEKGGWGPGPCNERSGLPRPVLQRTTTEV
jgi:hypothetical protein